MAKNCPNCGLINPDTVERCDCGYDFVAKTRRPARSEVAGRSSRNRKVSRDFLVGALEPQLHLNWLLAVLGLSVVAMICVIIAHQPEVVGLLIYFVIVVVGSSLIARRLEAKRRQAVPGTLPYTWGYFWGLAGLVSGCMFGVMGILGVVGPHKRLAYLAVVLHGDWRGPQNAAIDLVVAALFIPTHYYVIRRKKWAWVMGTVTSLNPVVWIINAIYGWRRWKEFAG